MQNLSNVFDPKTIKLLKKHGITKVPQETSADREKRMRDDDIKATQAYYQHDRKETFKSSLIGQPSSLRKTFEDFNVTNSKQARELSKAQSIAKRIEEGECHHYTFTGVPGSGKSMLAIAVLNQLRSTHTCYFVDFTMLMSLAHRFKDDKAMNEVNKIMRAIQLADIVVLDDIGSDSSMKRTVRESNDFTQSKLFEIAQYRDHKTTIITTNHTGTELAQIYNDKLVSRLFRTDGGNNVIKFDSEDYRRYVN
ncbi:ATP-binding protein [Companilactobacillus jidongensis]|uniref:ATP-binding protein n=1 Tax=Companilactobacillus jidongensis TaxID=2486006 RepID=UPI000F7A66A9|nr:ATP-binding protein [Companilactobacillus jidongensis]